tara:strand:+ start:126 stop:338 length:213 start_codon:yes stop_codon:yes gene_type:complete
MTSKIEKHSKEWEAIKKAFKADCKLFYKKWTYPVPYADALVKWTKEVIDEMDWEEIQPCVTNKQTITIEV